MTTTAPAAPRIERRSTFALFGLSATLTAGYGVLFTLVGDYRDEYGISETMVGLIIGVGFIVAFVAQTLLGPLGDRGHARTLIVIGSVSNVTGLLMMGFGSNAPVLLTGRIISGLAIGAAAPAIKRIVVVGSGENLGRNLGSLFSADVFGFAIGPVVSAVLVGPTGIPGPFVVIAALNLGVTAWVLSRVRVPESTEAQPTRFAFGLLKHPPFAGAVILGTAAFVMIGAFDALWDVVHTDLDTPEWMANLGIAIFAIPLVLLGPTAGKLAQSRGPFLVAGLGLVAAAVFLGVYGVLTVGALIFTFTLGHALTDGLTFAASGVAVGMTAPEQRQAGAQGVLGGMQSLGAGIMAPVTGWVYENHGQRAAYWLASGVVLAMTATGLGVAGPARRLRG